MRTKVWTNLARRQLGFEVSAAGHPRFRAFRPLGFRGRVEL